MAKEVFIVDGNHLFHRSYYAMEKFDLRNSEGFPTGALYGFVNYILKLKDDYNPEYFVITFDSPGKTFRHEIYADYKKSRTEKPPLLTMQFPFLEPIVKYLNIPFYYGGYYEADDVIAWLVKRCNQEEFKAVLVTKDKDLMVLVDENVRMLMPQNGGGFDFFGPAEVEKKMGVKPEQISDYLSLAGDSNDDVPGVPGIGDKRAVAVLKDAGSVDNILEDINLIQKESFRKMIDKNRDKLILSKKLVTLKDDLEFPLEGVELLKTRPVNKEACVEMFKELDFQSALEHPLFC